VPVAGRLPLCALRNNSGEVLRAVAAGESIVITNHGEPAALRTPVPTSTREQLVAAGRLVAAKRTFDRPPRHPRTIVSSTADELVELDRSAAT